jgi:hypothetical protein
MNKILILTSILILITSGCYYDNEEELYQFYTLNSCDTTNISFSQTIMPILQGNCSISACHVQGGTGTGLYENYSQVKAVVDNGALENRVLNLQDMPQAAPLPECQQRQIRIWIDGGALDN